MKLPAKRSTDFNGDNSVVRKDPKTRINKSTKTNEIRTWYHQNTATKIALNNTILVKKKFEKKNIKSIFKNRIQDFFKQETLKTT